MNGKKQILINRYYILFLFSLLCFLIYSNTISTPFQFDDYNAIVDNYGVKINDLSVASLKRGAFSHSANLRPLSYFTFAVNYYFDQSDTTNYHIFNMIIHILNAFLVYLIILKLFDHGSADDATRERLAVTAFFTALTWLVTPMNSHAVISISQRMTLLMSLFFLLGFFTYLIARKQKRPLYFLLSIIFFVLSMLSKENGVVLIPVIILYELIIVREGDLKGITRNEKYFLSVLALIVFITLIIYKDAIIHEIGIGNAKWEYTTQERVLTQFRMFSFYLTLLVMPLPGRLCVTHDIGKSTSLISPATTIFSIIFIVSLIVFAIIRMKKSPLISFAILWFFTTMAVETIIPLELIAYEYRTYLAIIILIFAGIDFVAGRYYHMNKKAVVITLSCIAAVLCVFTYSRGSVWEDEITLWTDVTKKYPDYLRAYNNLGLEQYKRKMYDEAEKNLSKVITIDNRDYRAFNNLGNVYYDKQNYGKAVLMYKKALKLNPEFVKAYGNIGMAYIGLKDNNTALAYLHKAIELEPRYNDAYIWIGVAHYNNNDNERALAAFKTAMKHNPGNDFLITSIKSLEEYLSKNKED